MLRRFAALSGFVCALAFVGAPALAQDAADVVVRLNRLENQMRQMSGHIEELQFENRQLKEQLRKFQEDVEFRFQENRGSGAPRVQSPPAGSTQTPSPPRAPAAPQPQRRSDVFDPSANPDAPGAPRPLGTTQPSAPLASAAPQGGGPLPLPGGALAAGDDSIMEDAPPGSAPLDLNQIGRTGAVPPDAAPPARSGPSVAATSTSDPRADYEAAYAYLLQRQYEQAEMGFRRFLQSHPRDRLVPDATYWLGESYLQRNRHREAAEQFLNLSTEHPSASKAPEALLKLGVSLNALGARDRACAVYAELERKYPQAGPSVRQGVEREQRRARCA